MYISQAQKEIALKEILTGYVKEILTGYLKSNFISEMTLKQTISTLTSQILAQQSPTMDGLGTRSTAGFWNLKKHLGDMVRAGINPEFKKVGLNNHGMVVALFTTKSSEHIVTKGPEDKEYQQKLVFTDWPSISKNPQLSFSQKVNMMLRGNIEMKCTCNSDNYHFGYARFVHQADKYLEPNEKQSQPAPVRNPEQFGIGCKHLALMFLAYKVQRVWGPKLMDEMTQMFMKAKKNKQPPQMNTSDMDFGPPEMKEREPIVSPDDKTEPIDRQPVMDKDKGPKPVQGPLQQTKYGDNKLLSKDDPRFGKPGFRGPDEPNKQFQGPLQQTKFKQHQLLSKDDPRYGKRGYAGPDKYAKPVPKRIKFRSNDDPRVVNFRSKKER